MEEAPVHQVLDEEAVREVEREAEEEERSRGSGRAWSVAVGRWRGMMYSTATSSAPMTTTTRFATGAREPCRRPTGPELAKRGPRRGRR